MSYGNFQRVFPVTGYISNEVNRQRHLTQKLCLRNQPCSHIFVSRWAGIIIPRMGIVVQMTETFSQDVFWLVATALQAGYVQLLEKFVTMSKHSTLHKVQCFLEGENKLYSVKFWNSKPLLQTNYQLIPCSKVLLTWESFRIWHSENRASWYIFTI